MHELAVCGALMDELAQVLRAWPGQRVVSVTLRAGPLSGVEPGLLVAAFPLASAGTPAAGAQLLLEEPAVRVRCPPCELESEVTSNDLACPRCGNWRTELKSGDELLLIRIELAGLKLPDLETAESPGEEEASHV